MTSQVLPPSSTVAVDPQLFTVTAAESLKKKLAEKGHVFKSLSQNLVDQVRRYGIFKHGWQTINITLTHSFLPANRYGKIDQPPPLPPSLSWMSSMQEWPFKKS